ncbi:aminodeoxychorismate synthase [Corynebacterium sp. L4756]|uniref:aminodeoxychorismate synthase n=1 Tax=unclassified Corynebacterium TaxID=2624378 RepID=UPI00374CAE82
MTEVIRTYLDPAAEDSGLVPGDVPSEVFTDTEITVVPGMDSAEDPAETDTLEQGQSLLRDKVMALVAARKKPMKPVTVLLDGPSGSGKTWFAARLSEFTQWQTVHLDEFYPGWHGLAQGSEMVADQVLRKMNPGFWRWDWHANAPAEWYSLDGRDDLIVEGVGAISPENIQAASARGTVITVMVTGPRTARRTRALERDEGYEDWFETWERQEATHFEELFDKEVSPDLVWEWRYQTEA